MGGSNTSEDLSGAPLMDEDVYLYNNTFLENEMGATGGNSMFAINNIVAGNTTGGFKLFGANSVIANNLFYNNKNNDLIEINGSAEQYDNLFSKDPLLDEITLLPGINSPCIDAGLGTLTLDGVPVIEISTEAYMGAAPDIGAMETEGAPGMVSSQIASGGPLIMNYPNPFRFTTNITLRISRTGPVRVDIYDLEGRHIQTLHNGTLDKGTHMLEWPAGDNSGNRLPGGIYMARMSTGNQVSSRKMILLH
jgi:hypothetical protein